jgi:hypothetical protein
VLIGQNSQNFYLFDNLPGSQVIRKPTATPGQTVLDRFLQIRLCTQPGIKFQSVSTATRTLVRLVILNGDDAMQLNRMDISKRLERIPLSKFHFGMLAVVALMMFFDGYDLLM